MLSAVGALGQRADGRAAIQHPCATFERHPLELGHQVRLADARLAADHHHAALARQRAVQVRLERGEIGRAPHEPAVRRDPARGRRRLEGHRGRGEIELGRVVEDAQLQVLQPGAGLDAHLGQALVGVAVGGERVRLAPGAVEREHQLGHRPLAPGVLADPALQLPDEVLVHPEPQLALEAVLGRAGALLLELPDRRLREVVVREVRRAQGRATRRAPSATPHGPARAGHGPAAAALRARARGSARRPSSRRECAGGNRR